MGCTPPNKKKLKESEELEATKPVYSTTLKEENVSPLKDMKDRLAQRNLKNKMMRERASKRSTLGDLGIESCIDGKKKRISFNNPVAAQKLLEIQQNQQNFTNLTVSQWKFS